MLSYAYMTPIAMDGKAPMSTTKYTANSTLPPNERKMTANGTQTTDGRLCRPASSEPDTRTEHRDPGDREADDGPEHESHRITDRGTLERVQQGRQQHAGPGQIHDLGPRVSRAGERDTHRRGEADDDQQLPEAEQNADGERPRPDGLEDALEPIPLHCSFAPARKPRGDLVREP